MSFFADIVTFLAFAVTIFTAVKVFFVNREVEKLTKSHLFDQRINDHVTSLRKTFTQMSLYVGRSEKEKFFSEDDIRQVQLIVNDCCDNCKNLQKKVPQKSLSSLNELLKLCDKLLGHRKKILFFRKLPYNINSVEKRQEFPENVYAFYKILQSLINEIEHTRKDKKASLKW